MSANKRKENSIMKIKLNEVPLEATMEELFGERRVPGCFITMAPGQWDAQLQAAYEHGWILLEVDEDENGKEFPSKAYRKESAST
jgi:hypothetical protein